MELNDLETWVEEEYKDAKDENQDVPRRERYVNWYQ